MVSSRRVFLRFAAILIASCMLGVDAFRYGGADETPERFVQNAEASYYSGPRLQFHVETAPSAVNDYNALDAVKAIVYRFEGSVIDFIPVQRVLPGNYDSLGCRPQDNSDPEELTPECEKECMNYGRYCEYHAFNSNYKNPWLANVDGSRLVEESARRTCIFQQLGAIGFFDYIDVMHHTECDHQYTDKCIANAYDIMKEILDVQVLNSCMGAMSPSLRYENPLLQVLIQNGTSLDKHLPSFTIDGVVHDLDTQKSVNGDAQAALDSVCSSIPEGVEKPKVCEFCNEYCMGMPYLHKDPMLCLWELKCNDLERTSFTDYLLQVSQGDAVDDEGLTDQIDDQTTPPGQGQTEEGEIETDTPEENETNSPVENGSTYDDSSSLNASSSEQPQEQDSPPAWYIVVIFCVSAFGFAAASLVIIAIGRQYRSKMIVDQYLKEQAVIRAQKDEGAVMPHWDQTLFSDQVDLDVEPALQYSDHIQPPTKNSFLPKLS
jgi:hypothetical protein